MNQPNDANQSTAPAIDHVTEAMIDAREREGDKAMNTLDRFIARRKAQETGQQAVPQTPPKPEQNPG